MMGCEVDQTLKAVYPGVRKCRAALMLRNQIQKDVAKNESVEGSQVAMASMRSRGRCARVEVSSFGGGQVGMGRGVLLEWIQIGSNKLGKVWGELTF
jgi:hypothetical protein